MPGHRHGGTVAVMRMFENAPRGKTVYLADVLKQLAAEGLDLTETQTRNAVYHVASRRYGKPFRVEVIIAGRAWKVFDAEPTTSPAQEARRAARRQEAEPQPSGPVVGEVLEILAVTKNGTLIVQDERGDTWKATKV